MMVVTVPVQTLIMTIEKSAESGEPSQLGAGVLPQLLLIKIHQGEAIDKPVCHSLALQHGNVEIAGIFQQASPTHHSQQGPQPPELVCHGSGKGLALLWWKHSGLPRVVSWHGQGVSNGKHGNRSRKYKDEKFTPGQDNEWFKKVLLSRWFEQLGQRCLFTAWEFEFLFLLRCHIPQFLIL